MSKCSLCGKDAYDQNKDKICYACRRNDESGDLELGLFYMLAGHTFECAYEQTFNFKTCICDPEKKNEKNKSFKRIDTAKNFK